MNQIFGKKETIVFRSEAWQKDESGNTTLLDVKVTAMPNLQVGGKLKLEFFEKGEPVGELFMGLQMASIIRNITPLLADEDWSDEAFALEYFKEAA
jgi:hypothetical protein